MSKQKNIYARGDRLWCNWYDVDGKRHQDPVLRGDGSPLLVGHEDEAAEILAATVRAVNAERKKRQAGAQPEGPLTVRRHQVGWTADRVRRGLTSAGGDAAWFAHAFKIPVGDPPVPFGDLELTKVRATHVRRVVRELVKQIGPQRENLASGSVRNVYAVIRALFRDAVADELIAATPCVLLKGELPPKEDKDSTWRIDAVFTREEVELLISDERLEEWRRVLYATLFLTGMRIGEFAARRWRDLHLKAEPLGKILVRSSFSHHVKKEKAPKTGVAREVPIHPTLAKVLAAWKLGGWERRHGRAPTQDDLVLSTPRGGYMDPPYVLRLALKDLELVGLRRRRIHDTRATFISLGLEDGAVERIFRKITHLSKRDIIDAYNRPPFPALCAEIVKLRIRLLEGRVLALPLAASAVADCYTAVTPTGETEKNPGTSMGSGVGCKRAIQDSKTLYTPDKGAPSDKIRVISRVQAAPSGSTPHVGGPECNSVTVAALRSLLERATACLEGDAEGRAEAIELVRQALRELGGAR